MEEYKKKVKLAKEEEKPYCEPKTLKKVISSVTKRRNLPEDSVTIHAIQKQIYRGTEHINEHQERGLSSPLLAIKSIIVTILLQIAQIRESLSTTQAVNLVNSVIHRSKYQLRLINFKEKYCTSALPTVGVEY